MHLLRTIFSITLMTISMKAYAYETAFSAKQVQEKITSFDNQNNILVLLDVDDTIITPESLTFRSAPYNQIMDEIKANRHRYPNYEEIISNWRLQRKAILIDPNWPQILNDLKNKYTVFALTKVNTGKFGNIESMEEWRYQELRSLGINFSEHKEQTMNQSNQPSLFKGIMMTGSASKKDTLQKYIHLISSVDKIVFVDDRAKNLKEIDEFCQEHNIEFLGIHYRGLEKIAEKQDEKIFLLQKNTLINEAKWLSDEEAKLLINSGN